MDEYWIWTKTLAFDNTHPDFGVKEYLRKAGRKIGGLSLLMSEYMDFILSPYRPLAETDGKLGCSGSSGIYNNLKIPPMGIFLFEERDKK